MKKIALISVLLTYLILNLGISVKFHYCGNSISFIDFFPVEHKHCCEDKKASCCKDKIAYVNPETTQVATQTIEFSFPDYARFNVPLQDFSFLSFIDTERTEDSIQGESDNVFYRKLPLYLAHRVIIV